MRFQSTVFAFAASLALVSAQGNLITQIPACAIPCLAAATAASGCGLTDYKCQCTTGQSKIASSLQTCVPPKCSADDQAKLVSLSGQICAAVGVTISSQAVASASSVAASAASSASGAVASAASSASAAIASASASASNAVASKTGSAPASTSNAAAGTFAGMGAVALGFAAVLGL